MVVSVGSLKFEFPMFYSDWKMDEVFPVGKLWEFQIDDELPLQSFVVSLDDSSLLLNVHA